MIIAGKYVIAYFLLSDGNNLFIIRKVSRVMKLAEKIMALRKQRGWSQEELAQQLSVSRQSVSKWESGVSEPSVEKLKQLADLFDVTMDEFLYTDFEANKLPREVGKLLDDKEEALLSICRRLRDQNKEKVYEYAALLLRDEHNS